MRKTPTLLWFNFDMGQAKREMEENDERGWQDVGTTICSGCVIDSALVAAVKADATTTDCSYCGRTPSAPFEIVLELVVDGLRHEYEDPTQNLGWDEGPVGTVHDTWDLMRDLEITEMSNVQADLDGAIRQAQWCQRDPYAATPTQALTWGWEAFRQFVKHERRYTFLSEDHTTGDGAGEIPMHAMPAAIAEAVEKSGLVVPLEEGSKWWRVRVHEPGEEYSLAADIGPAPNKDARDNRMSPKGMGAFYGASSKDGARREVAGYANSTDEGSVAAFKTIVPLDVLDLRNLPGLPSLFDPDRRHLRAPIQFLQGFVKDITQVADPSDKQNLDYIPTQVVAETFRYKLSGDHGPLAGILWRSSKDPSVTTSVLFIQNTGVADHGSETDRTKLVLDPTSVELIHSPL